MTANGFTNDGRGGQKTGFDVTGKLNRKDFGVSWNAIVDRTRCSRTTWTSTITVEANKPAPKPAPPAPAARARAAPRRSTASPLSRRLPKA